MGWMQDRAKARNNVGGTPVNPRGDRLNALRSKKAIPVPMPRSKVEEDDELELDAMAMNREATREAYEAREIVQDGPDRQEQMEANAEKLEALQPTRSRSEASKANEKAMSEFQKTLKPIRSSQSTDLSKG